MKTIILASMLLCSCASSQVWKTSDGHLIVAGMTEAQVTAVLGAAQKRVSLLPGKRALNYGEVIVIVNGDGIVEQVLPSRRD